MLNVFFYSQVNLYIFNQLVPQPTFERRVLRSHIRPNKISTLKCSRCLGEVTRIHSCRRTREGGRAKSRNARKNQKTKGESCSRKVAGQTGKITCKIRPWRLLILVNQLKHTSKQSLYQTIVIVFILNNSKRKQMCVILKFCTKQTHSSFIDLPYGMSVTLNTHG